MLDELPPEFAKLAEVWALLQREHIDSATLDPAVATDGAIRGMMDSINDPHASFLDSEQYSMMRQDIQGFFEGIGAEVSVRNGLITIVSRYRIPLPRKPESGQGTLYWKLMARAPTVWSSSTPSTSSAAKRAR